MPGNGERQAAKIKNRKPKLSLHRNFKTKTSGTDNKKIFGIQIGDGPSFSKKMNDIIRLRFIKSRA